MSLLKSTVFLLSLISLTIAHGPGESHKYAALADLSQSLATAQDDGGYDTSDPGKAVIFNSTGCSQLPTAIFSEIQSYKSIVDQIIAASTLGAYKGATYGNLSYFVDTYDDRLSGSDGLEASIDFLASQMRSLGFDNVRTEPVPNVPAWKRFVLTLIRFD
jgi:hypothetical protein